MKGELRNPDYFLSPGNGIFPHTVNEEERGFRKRVKNEKEISSFHVSGFRCDESKLHSKEVGTLDDRNDLFISIHITSRFDTADFFSLLVILVLLVCPS